MGGDGNKPLWGYCSACEYLKFPPDASAGSRIAQKERLGRLFLEHFNKVHLHEDASQSAVRIVSEGTEKPSREILMEEAA